MMKNIFNTPTWSELSAIGKNRLVTRTYLFLLLVPFMVTILSKIEISVGENADKFQLLRAIPFSWKVFFWCAFFFTLGSVLYQLFAPKIVRDNRTWHDFENAGKTWGHLMGYSLDIGIDYDKWWKVLDDASNNDEFDAETFINSYSGLDRTHLAFVYINQRMQKQTMSPLFSQFDPPEVTFKRSESHKKNLKEDDHENNKITFWNIYEHASNYNIWAKRICYISFILGFILLGWLLLSNVWIVLSKTLIS
jgi:hypothetical protein